jgi:hypothetical protein
MTRNYFSKKGGPYFVGQTFSQHIEKPEDKGLDSVSLIGRIKSFFKFPGLRRKK